MIYIYVYNDIYIYIMIYIYIYIYTCIFLRYYMYMCPGSPGKNETRVCEYIRSEFIH